jgi:membrane protease YdiL (CAAX protease family)
MTRIRPPVSSDREQGKAWRQLLAAAVGVLPLYTILIIFQLHRDEPIPIQGFILYLAVISPLAIAVTWALLRFFCRENLRDLNLKPGKLSSDMYATLALSAVIILSNIVSNSILSQLFSNSAPDTSVRDLFLELARNPKLFALFVCLLIPMGAAAEEVIRVFLLSRLWKVWPSTTGKVVTVGISACLFGLIHLYRGPSVAAWTAIFGLIMALYYLRFGRVVPLILAHYLTNGLQVIVFAVVAR